MKIRETFYVHCLSPLFFILQGSIVEGACLSRIFHPSKEASLELEADVMYVVGSISQTVAENCFQVIIIKIHIVKVRKEYKSNRRTI